MVRNPGSFFVNIMLSEYFIHNLTFSQIIKVSWHRSDLLGVFNFKPIDCFVLHFEQLWKGLHVEAGFRIGEICAGSVSMIFQYKGIIDCSSNRKNFNSHRRSAVRWDVIIMIIIMVILKSDNDDDDEMKIMMIGLLNPPIQGSPVTEVTVSARGLQGSKSWILTSIFWHQLNHLWYALEVWNNANDKYRVVF